MFLHRLSLEGYSRSITVVAPGASGTGMSKKFTSHRVVFFGFFCVEGSGFFGHVVRLVGSQFSYPGLNPGHGSESPESLTTIPVGNSPKNLLHTVYHFVLFEFCTIRKVTAPSSFLSCTCMPIFFSRDGSLFLLPLNLGWPWEMLWQKCLW